MSWYSALLTSEQSSNLQNKFRMLFWNIPRPQTAFMYESADPTIVQKHGVKEIYYAVFFTPSCATYMPELISEFGLKECETPKREDVIGLCTVQDFEELVWK